MRLVQKVFPQIKNSPSHFEELPLRAHQLTLLPTAISWFRLQLIRFSSEYFHQVRILDHHQFRLKTMKFRYGQGLVDGL